MSRLLAATAAAAAAVVVVVSRRRRPVPVWQPGVECAPLTFTRADGSVVPMLDRRGERVFCRRHGWEAFDPV